MKGRKSGLTHCYRDKGILVRKTRQEFSGHVKSEILVRKPTGDK